MKHENESKETLVFPKTEIIVLISGNGSNLQAIIDSVNSSKVNAEIVEVISNREDAFGSERARKAGIETRVISSKGKLKDRDSRNQVEEFILVEIVNHHPKIIVLAGFMMILSDKFLKKMQDEKIMVINLHPALFREKFALPGVNSIERAFNMGFPFSGVTVHQLLPGLSVDSGPVILEQEVVRDSKDTLETWKAKVHAAEHTTLPRALQIAIDTINQNKKL